MLTGIFNPILSTGRSLAINNFEYVNPVNIYNKLKGLSSTTMVKPTIEGVEGVEGVQTESQNTDSDNTTSTSKIVFLTITYVILLIMLAFVANDMIMYPWIVRLILTCFVIALSIVNPLTPFMILIYYMVNGMWRFYVNTTLPPEEKKRVIPYLYGFIPLTTSQPVSLLGKIITAPFRYDVEVDAENLKWDRKEWLKTVLGSFPNAKETLDIGGMNSLYKKYTESLGKIHEYDKIVESDGNRIVETVNPFSGKPSAPATPPPAPSPATPPPAPSPTNPPPVPK